MAAGREGWRGGVSGRGWAKGGWGGGEGRGIHTAFARGKVSVRLQMLKVVASKILEVRRWEKVSRQCGGLELRRERACGMRSERKVVVT